jgi:serine protein kinase
MAYATAAERMVAAIGEPQVVDSTNDARLGRIVMNRTIKIYPAFAEFFGMEDTAERIVNFFRYSAEGLEEHILPICQYFAYIEVNDEGGGN